MATEGRRLAPVLCQKLRQYCYPIVGCCQEVHKEMGPFLNEYMYQDAMVFALEDTGFTGDNMTKEYYFTTKYKDREIKHPHKVDFLVNKKVFVECKAVACSCFLFQKEMFLA